MIDWRELMPKPSAAITPRNHPQYPQKGSSGRGFEDIEDRIPVNQAKGLDHPTPNQWIEAWRELATITNGIEKSDRRFLAILDLLEKCDHYFEQDDWPGFKQTADQVQTWMNRQPET